MVYSPATVDEQTPITALFPHDDHSEPALSTFGSIWKLGRIHFCFEAPTWCLLGSLLFRASHGAFSPSAALFSASVVFLVNVSINYANEYFDYEADFIGARTKEDKTGRHGGSGVLQSGSLPRWAALAMAGAVQGVILLGIMASRFFEGRGSSVQGFVLWFGIASMVGAQQYVGPPLRLHYNGGGEVISSLELAPGPIIYGFASQLTAFRRMPLSMADCFAAMSPATCRLLIWTSFHELARIFVMHAADINEDIAAKKHTLVSLVGYRKTKVLYMTAEAIAFVVAWDLLMTQPRAAWLLAPVYAFKAPIVVRIVSRLEDLVRGTPKGFGSTMPGLASLETWASALVMVVMVLIKGDCLA